MATLLPFPGLVVKSEWADQVVTGPYDAYTPEQRIKISRENPYSFLNVTKSREDLPEESRDDVENLLASCSDAMNLLYEADVYNSYDEPSLFLYRLEIEGHAQTGVMGLLPVTDDDDQQILRHELFRPGRAQLMAHHLMTVGASSSPVSLTYRSDKALEEEMTRLCLNEPELISNNEGVLQTVWVVSGDDAQKLSSLFEEKTFYVTDGHHRLAAASEARDLFGDAGGPLNHIQAVLFPDSEMLVLPFHRQIQDRKDRTPEELFDSLTAIGSLTSRENVSEARPDAGQVGIYLNHSWHTMNLPPSSSNRVVDQLDVSRLQDGILKPLFDIEDPGNDPVISYVPEPVGVATLESQCDAAGSIGFILPPTSINELMAVADGGERMPPKSSYFEPKPRSGVFVRRLDREAGWVDPTN